MSRRRDVDKLVNALTRALGRWAHTAPAQWTDAEYDTWQVLWRQMREDYESGRLRSRVHKLVNANPVLVAAGTPKQLMDKIVEQYQNEMIESVIGGRHHIPRGIEHGDMWLAPAAEVQRRLQDKQGEDAVFVVMAKRDEDGRLVPSFFWTEDEELIAEAQKGHRRYMELVARERGR